MNDTASLLGGVLLLLGGREADRYRTPAPPLQQPEPSLCGNQTRDVTTARDARKIFTHRKFLFSTSCVVLRFAPSHTIITLATGRQIVNTFQDLL